jgi:hypothetical protein
MNNKSRLARMRRRDLEDLIGNTVEEEDRPEAPEDKLSFGTVDAYLANQGVSVQWLAKAFRMTRHAVEKKVGDLRPIARGTYGNPLYDLPEAAAYLIEPKIDIDAYLKNIKPEKLPERLRESVWNSMLKRQRWEEKAGDLWRTDIVMTRFAETLANVRQQLQQIPDRVERLTGLSIDQYKIVRNAIDQVQEEIYDEILNLSKGRYTGSQLNSENLVDADDEDAEDEREDLA